jgi:hypothetical protein
LPLGVAFEHDLQELVLDTPRRGVGDPEMALELEREDGVFLLSEQVHGENQLVRDSLIEAKIVPAVNEAWWWQCLHRMSSRVRRAAKPSACPYSGQTMPCGQRQPNSASSHRPSVPYCARKSGRLRPF